MVNRISILGASGAMGRAVSRAAESLGARVVNGVSEGGDLASLFDGAEVVVDFSAPAATEALLALVDDKPFGLPLVIGTTNLTERQTQLMARCANKVPIFYSPNMSFSVAVLSALTRIAAGLLGDDFDIEILDIHHKLKKDAPSGTALMLGQTAANARGGAFVARDSVGPRERGAIGFSSQRCGSVCGVHEVSLVGELECLKIRHEAYSRDVFARGALEAAAWVAGRPPGLYSMSDFIAARLESVVGAARA